MCPFCAAVAEYAAGDLIKHILADHPHEATLLAGSIPLLVAAANGQWFWVILGLIVAALLLEDLQTQKKAQARLVQEAPAWLPVVYVPTVNLNVPIYGPHFPHRFYPTPNTIIH
jgi:hypothetical protein